MNENKEEITKISKRAKVYDKEKGNQTICLIPFQIFGGSGVRITSVSYRPEKYYKNIFFKNLKYYQSNLVLSNPTISSILRGVGCGVNQRSCQKKLKSYLLSV